MSETLADALLRTAQAASETLAEKRIAVTPSTPAVPSASDSSLPTKPKPKS